MKLNEITPVLRTPDLKGSVEFYTKVLGFEYRSMKEDWGWALVKRDSIVIMLASPNQQEPFHQPVFTGSLYIETDDADALWNQLKAKVKICYPIEDFEYGMREFAIYDNNGYLLQFGQEIPDTSVVE